jgi:hypothetical protein
MTCSGNGDGGCSARRGEATRSHVSADGGAIPHECDTCHTIVGQGPEGKVETSLQGLTFKHPVDISGMWKTVPCSDCHDGTTMQ